MRAAAFAIVFVLALASFSIGMSLVGTAYNRLAPGYLFGSQVSSEEDIRVIESGRHYLRFSNDPGTAISRVKLGGLNAISIVARFIIVIGLFYALTFPTVRLLERLDPKLASEVWSIVKFRRG